MNKKTKTILSVLLLGLILSISSTSLATPLIIHESTSTEHLATGVDYEKVMKFTDKGWWNINVVRVDLTNEHTDVKVMFSKKGISHRDTVSNMVRDTGAIAGINGDFFQFSPATPLEGAINDGEFISSPKHSAYGPRPHLVIDNNKNPYIAWFDRKMTVTSSATNKPITISAINKASVNYNEVVLYNKYWADKSIGNVKHKDMIEVVVKDDIVTDVRIGKGPVAIPKNGYILTGRSRVESWLLDNFHVGDKVKLNITSTPNFENIKMAIGGGAKILENGKIVSKGTNMKGNNPRTGIGITKDKSQLILVTIDGRDSTFIGVPQNTFASILKDLGAYDAIEFDGGGSTTMALKQANQKKPKVVNKPSDGSQRRVIDGIGVYNNAPKGILDYIEVYTDDTKMFKNTTRKFYIKGYDQQKNPIEVDQSKVTFTVSGIEGDFNGNTLKALSSGSGKVTANYEGLTNTINIRVLEDINDIKTDVDKFNIEANSQKKLDALRGIDNNGLEALIYPEDVSWEVIGDIGYIENGVFYSSDKTGSGAITARMGNGLKNILVSIGSKGTLIESFENLDNFSFSNYPKEVKGSISSSNEAKEGNSSLKLQYDFTEGDGNRAAYANFMSNGKEGLSLDNSISKLGLWVYGNENRNWLRGTIIDGNGKEHNIDFTKNIDWNGWQYVTADIPSKIVYPIKLQRIYVVEIDKNKRDTGEILIDGLTAIYPIEYSKVDLPEPTKFTDIKNKETQKAKDGLSVGITYVPKNINDVTKSNSQGQIKKQVNKHDVGIFYGALTPEFKKGLKTKSNIEIIKGYKPYRYGGTLFIKADDRNKGLRSTNPNQWIWLKHDLTQSKEKNIVLLLQNPINKFSDKLEADLLQQYLSEAQESGKNIWVVYGGTKTNTSLKDGIRYIELNTKAIKNPQDIYSLSMIEFTINGEDMTYQIRPLFQK